MYTCFRTQFSWRCHWCNYRWSGNLLAAHWHVPPISGRHLGHFRWKAEEEPMTIWSCWSMQSSNIIPISELPNGFKTPCVFENRLTEQEIYFALNSPSSFPDFWRKKHLDSVIDHGRQHGSSFPAPQTNHGFPDNQDQWGGFVTQRTIWIWVSNVCFVYQTRLDRKTSALGLFFFFFF